MKKLVLAFACVAATTAGAADAQPDSKLGLAEAYLGLGDTKSARPIYEEMLKARPGARNIQARLDEIDRLEKEAAEKAPAP